MSKKSKKPIRTDRQIFKEAVERFMQELDGAENLGVVVVYDLPDEGAIGIDAFRCCERQVQDMLENALELALDDEPIIAEGTSVQ